ncbi:MAG: FtsX-like permease family protein [Gammaproteobacteria bacterium]|nr:FtsX-like permease family protein [Gammaproteobacteria bacterium]
MDYPSLRVSFALARRELRGGLNGFRIFLACLALGVAAIASVQSVSSSILQGLRDDGQAILGGDISVRQLYRQLTDEQLAYLNQTTEASIHFTEMRTMARGLAGEQSTLIELKGVDGMYPLFGRMELQDEVPFSGILERTGGVWGAVVEAAVIDRLGVQIGDRILVGDTDFEIRALIKREPDRVGGGGRFGLGPRVMVSTAAMAATGLLQTGSLVYYHYRFKLPAGANLDGWQNDLDRKYPGAGWRVRDYRNASPTLERMVNRLTLFLTLVGLTALLVGGVGVSNAVKAYLDTKLNTIAMLKCVGAPNRTIFQVYMSQIMILAVAGIGIGLILGGLVPKLAAMLLQDMLPFDLSLSAHPGALVISAVFGLLVTVAFSVWPLARVHEVPAGALFRDMVAHSRVRPRLEYIVTSVVSGLLLAGLAIGTAENVKFAVWFVIGAAATMLVFRLAAWGVLGVASLFRRPRHPGLRLAMANLQRPGSPTANVVLSLGLGLTVLVAIILIEGNMSRQVQESIPEKAPDFFFIDIQSAQMDGFEESVNGIVGVDELQRVPYFRGRIVSIKGKPPEQTLVSPEYEWMIRGDRGLTYGATKPENTKIITGEWWPEDYSGPPLLSVHKDVSKGFGVSVGDNITLNVLGRDIDATIANIRELEWSSMQLNFAIMFSPEPLRNAPHTFIATVAAAPTAEEQVQKTVSKDFPSVTMIRIKDALDRVNDVLNKIGAAVRSVAGVTMIAGTLVLAGAIAAGHRRRVYDSVVLKVLGATRRDVLQAFLLEYGLLGLLTAAIASVVGSITAWAVLTQIMQTGWIFIPSAVIATTLLCTGTTLGFGFFGTWRALGQKAAPLLRNE